MPRNFIFALLALILFPIQANADLLNAMQCVCHLNNGKQDCGTGFAYAEDDEYYYIMTAGHVAANFSDKIYCYFYTSGQVLPAVEAELLEIDYDKDVKYEISYVVRDLAKLRCKKSAFTTIKPTVVPLAKPDEELKIDQGILSIGCPGPKAPVSYASMFYGKINLLTGEDFYFTPAIKPGRSGSPVFNSKGDRVIGVVIWTSARAIGPVGMANHFQPKEEKK